ncbi:hypothetical protein [Streptomyces sp. BH104]|uniref:hypothetical protein n=1 Tax=unclassified Streptomyces TaxID=2593676 RepID=UPI003BB5D676
MSDSSGRVGRTVQWATEQVESVRERVPFVTRTVRQFGAVRLLDSSTRLAAQAFLTAIPMLFVVAAFAPSAVREQLLESSRTAMGLSGDSLDQVKQVYGAGDSGTRDTSGVIGVLVTLLSWLIVLFTVVCVGISVGHVVARERPVARVLRAPEAG